MRGWSCLSRTLRTVIHSLGIHWVKSARLPDRRRSARPPARRPVTTGRTPADALESPLVSSRSLWPAAGRAVGGGAMRRRRTQWAALAAIVLLAAVLRIYALGDVPAGLYCDEAGNGYNAYSLGTRGHRRERHPLAAVRLVVRHCVQEPRLHLRRHSAGEAARPERVQRPPHLGAVRHRHRRRACSSSGGRSSIRGSGSGRRCFLALSPWHLHFSRIAFELIALPFFFVTGCVFLVRFTQGRRTLPAALACFAACVYAYAPAALFVPAFLLGFGVLYALDLLRHWRQLLLALVVAAAILAPAAVFFSTPAHARHDVLPPHHVRRSAASRGCPQIERFGHELPAVLLAALPVARGRPDLPPRGAQLRRALPVHDPFVLLGAGTALLRRDRASKLVLWWAALYPVAPSLMNEIPSATRGIIGAPLFCAARPASASPPHCARCAG